MKMTKLINIFFSFIAVFIITGCEVNNKVAVIDSWARANAPGQTSGAAYMTFISAQDSTMIKAESLSASSVEIHSMSMDDGVMKMRMLNEYPISAGKPAKLAPGGFHLMFFDLKKQLITGETVDVKLTFKDNAGKLSQQLLTLPIKEAQ